MAGIDGIGSIQDNFEKYKDMFSDGKNDAITMESFYQLLVAEMQNQDPLEPSSNTEFISQMASMTALQSQQDANKTQIQSYANSLVGKTVTVATVDGKVDTGVVSSVTSGDTPKVTVNGKSYALSSVSQIHSGDASGASSSIGDYGAFATGLLGKSVTVQAFDSMGTSYIDEGVVESLEIQNGNVRIIVGGYAYDVTDVVRVREADAQQTAAVQQTAAQGRTYDDVMQALEGLISSVPAQQTANGTNAAEEILAAALTDEPDIADIVEEAEEAANSALLQLFE